jgi:uncharacterized small protein (DUF1192 family)
MFDEKVVHAFPSAELPDNLMQIEKRKDVPMFCQHENVRLDAHDRSIHCAKCGAALDPFNFLLSNAKTIQLAWENHRMVMDKVREINERINVLSKEEKRLRAQVKRHQEKGGAVISVRGKSTL